MNFIAMKNRSQEVIGYCSEWCLCVHHMFYVLCILYVLYVCMYIMYVQWKLSMKGTMNKGHLSNEDTVCSPNQIELCTNLSLN